MVLTPTATPTTTLSVAPAVAITPTTTPSVTLFRSHKIGDKVSVCNTEITVTEVFITTEVMVEGNGSFLSIRGEEFYEITFDVVTKNQLDFRHYWYSNRFI